MPGGLGGQDVRALGGYGERVAAVLRGQGRARLTAAPVDEGDLGAGDGVAAGVEDPAAEAAENLLRPLEGGVLLAAGAQLRRGRRASAGQEEGHQQAHCHRARGDQEGDPEAVHGGDGDAPDVVRGVGKDHADDGAGHGRTDRAHQGVEAVGRAGLRGGDGADDQRGERGVREADAGAQTTAMTMVCQAALIRPRPAP